MAATTEGTEKAMWSFDICPSYIVNFTLESPLWNHWTKLNQNYNRQPHPPLKMASFAKNKNFWNCLLLYIL